MRAKGPRWEHDARGVGNEDGSWITAHVDRLREALDQPAWVTESPEEHLLPQLERSVEAAGSPWRLIEATVVDGVYQVTLEWTGACPRLRQLRTDATRLIGEIAEGTTFIHQSITDAAIEYHVVTGQLEGTTPFAPHGHLIRLIVHGPAIPDMVSGSHATPSPKG